MATSVNFFKLTVSGKYNPFLSLILVYKSPVLKKKLEFSYI